jgi:hypothetical protein
MATTTVQTLDVSQALADLLGDIEGLRIYTYVADSFRPDGLIIGQPDIDWTDPTAGFCAATWSFPCTLIVSRNSDLEAQKTLSRLVSEIVIALTTTPVPEGLFSVEPQNARPTTVNTGGSDLPAYQVNVKIRA